MKHYPLISVVVPAYNHAAYIAQAIRSIVDQDYSNLEIILIDDGSTDHTAEVAENALQRGQRPYQLIRQENAGAHAALNHGIQMAGGEYIAILNSDDRYLPGRLTTLFNAVTASNRRFAYTRVSHVDSIGFPHPYQAHYLRQLEEVRQFPAQNFALLRNNLAVTTGNFFFHRSLYAEVGGFAAYVTSHDWDYILRVLLVEEPLFVDETLLEYRIHSRGTLQKHLAVVNEETAQIMMNYLTRVGEAKNPLAPGPVRWGEVWNAFSDHCLERFRVFPQVRAQLDSMRSKGEYPGNLETPAAPLPTLPKVEDPFEPLVDLDLTQITLNISSPLKDAKTQPRLLLILPWMVMGGAERFTLNLIDQLNQRGWQVSIACTAPSGNNWEEEFARRTGDIVTLPDLVPIKDYPRYLRFYIELRDFDAVLLQGSIEGYRLLPTLRTLFPRLPILDYLHFVTPDWMDGGYPRLSSLYRDAIDLTATSCEQVKRWMMAKGAAETHLRVCPIGVDSAYWKPDASARERVRRELGINEDEVALIYAARLEVQKQPLVFAETLRLLNDQGVPFRALVAGDGSLRQELDRKISQYRLNDKVTALGAVRSEDMPTLLAAGDLFFLPSQNEGISSAVYEAMSTGLPVVGADVGGQAELVTPECGILIPVMPEPELPGAYAYALKALIDDTPRRQRMGSASRECIASGFTLNDMGKCMAGILAEVTRLKRAGHLAPAVLTPEQRLVRETQHVVEYLQARQAWRNINDRHVDLMHQHADLSDKYFELLQPKPPSHWFYLWIRQLILPFSNYLNRSRYQQTVGAFQKWLKHTWIKK